MPFKEETPTYGTTDEINFVKSLGKKDKTEVRIAKVRAYIDRMDLRTNWGKIDPQMVKVHAITHLGKLMGINM